MIRSGFRFGFCSGFRSARSSHFSCLRSGFRSGFGSAFLFVALLSFSFGSFCVLFSRLHLCRCQFEFVAQCLF